MENYNKTHLDIEGAFERNVLHRDYFAHYLRWSHICKILAYERKQGRILDLGCGPGQLAETLYRNRIMPKEYKGIDIRSNLIKKAQEKFKNCSWASFECHDLCDPSLNLGISWDYIIALEVLEHIKKGQLAHRFIDLIKASMGPETTLILSTPCYDPKMGAADNHTLDGEVNEYGYDELKKILQEHFWIISHYGTFASQKDIIQDMDCSEQKVFNELKGYYDSNFLAVVFAPMHPARSRNCIWELKLKR